MAACPKISRGVFSKNFRPGGYTKNTPYPPLFPLPGINQEHIVMLGASNDDIDN